MICLLDFCFDEVHPEKVIHTIKLIDEETGEVFDETLTQIMVELPKFKKAEDELSSRKEVWFYVLNKLQYLTEIPLSLQQDVIFQRVFEIALLSNLTKQEMNAYELTLKDQRDYKNTIDYATDKGVDLGDKNRQIATAIKMIHKNYPLTEIKEVMDLSLEELQKLAELHSPEDDIAS